MRSRPVPRVIRGFAFFVRPLLMVLTKRDWAGQENLPSTSGYVLAPNHVSHIDPILLGHFQFDQHIAPRYLAKATLFDGRVLGPLMRSARQVPVYRTSAGAAAESVRAACAAVEAGEIVTVYPEGTITRDPDGWPMAGHTGAVRIALATGCPLIPVVQWGPQQILRPYTKRLRFFPRATIRIRVGTPMDLSGFADRQLDESVLREATDALMHTLTDMMIELRGDKPRETRES